MTIIGGGGKMARVLTRFLLRPPRTAGVSPSGLESLCLVDQLFREPAATGLAADLSKEFNRLPIWVNYEVDPDDRNLVLRWCPASPRCTVLDNSSSPDQARVPCLLALLPSGASQADIEQWVTTREQRSTFLSDRLEALQGLPIIHLVGPTDAEVVLQQSDITMFAVPYKGAEDFEKRIVPYVRYLRPESLVLDITSIKQAPLAALEKLVPKNIAVLGTHPLFGDAVANPLGQVVAMVDSAPDRYKSPWAEWLRSKLIDVGMLVTPCTAEQHDAAMSYVQVLTHFVLLSLGACLRETMLPDSYAADLLPFRSPIFEPLVYLSARVSYQASSNKGTYLPIQQFAANSQVREAFLREAHRLNDAIVGSVQGNDGPLVDIIDRVAKWEISAETSDGDTNYKAGSGGTGPFSPENVRAMTNAFVAQPNRTRAELVQSRGQIRGIVDETSVPPKFFVGQLYMDPGKHDRVDVSSRIRFFHTDVSRGLIEHPDRPTLGGQDGSEPSGSVPLGTARILTEDEMFRWLDAAIEAEAFESQRRDRRIAEETARLRNLGFVGEKTLSAVCNEDPQRFKMLAAEANNRLGVVPGRKSLDDVRRHLLRKFKDRERLTDAVVGGTAAETGRFRIKFRRSIRVLVPAWFDNSVAGGVVGAAQNVPGSKARIKQVDLSAVAPSSAAEGWKLVDVNLQIILHPLDLVKHRCDAIQQLFPDAQAPRFSWLDTTREYAFASSRVSFPEPYDGSVPHSCIDREVARRARYQVEQVVQVATDWLLHHGALPLGEPRQVKVRVVAPFAMPRGGLLRVLQLLPDIEAQESAGERMVAEVASGRAFDFILLLRTGDVDAIIRRVSDLLSGLGCSVEPVSPPAQGVPDGLRPESANE